MRVLLLDIACRPATEGAPLEAWRFAARLARHGVRVDLVTGAPLPDSARGDRVHEAEVRGLHVYAPRPGRRRRARPSRADSRRCLISAFRLARRLLRARHHDLVHAFQPQSAGPLLRFLPLDDAVVVVSLRESTGRRRALTFPGLSRWRRSRRALRPIARWSWHRADARVAGCEHLARAAEATEPTGKVAVIRNGVDLELFRPGDRTARADEPLRCLAVGPLVDRMAVDDLLRAWSRLDRGACRLEIAGTGKRETRLRELARTLGVEDGVIFTGPLDHEQIAGRYRVADLFVLCPSAEVCGTAFARALAAGLPVVASRVGGIPELVVNGANGYLVPPGDPDAIAAAVRRLSGAAALRSHMGAANRARAEELLSWEKMGDAYEKLYQELLDSRRRLSRRPLLVRPRTAHHSLR